METANEIKATRIFSETISAQEKIIVNEGGARSSKTYSIAQALIRLAAAEPKREVYTICRKTLPALKGTAMRDFFEILRSWDWYREVCHNKTDNIYRINNTEIEFISLDESQKIRGRKRKRLWVNEANEIDFDSWRQLMLRTSKQVYIDYNPSDEYHWIYDSVLTRKDIKVIHSTYLDNPFLEPEIRKEIELLKDTDENYWNIFGLGLKGKSSFKIYTHWTLVDSLPDNPDNVFYGIDFGFNNETSIVKVVEKDRCYTWKELLYKKHLTNQDLIREMDVLRNEGQITSTMKGYCDAAEPNRIEEIKRGMTDDDGRHIAGFNVEAADKAVGDGIDYVKSRPLAITKDSVNLQKEAKNYMWKTKDGKPVEGEPVKVNDHALDAGRYGEYTHYKSGYQKLEPRIRFLGR